eukprot:GHVU01023940.1.p1 GENE.GHVU01023940.1~~GHVU01023940.1.p1  ORF type:complete len:255 (+),score=48.46 GHVU01023940.1:66-830(+)
MRSSTDTSKGRSITLHSFHKKPLPDSCIAYTSPEGKRLFSEALREHTMEAFFPLSEQFRTQEEPSYCGISTLVIVLNALQVDPYFTWKGPWRWYHEGMLDCCIDLEKVKERGVNFDEFACLGRCNGLEATAHRVYTDLSFTFPNGGGEATSPDSGEGCTPTEGGGGGGGGGCGACPVTSRSADGDLCRGAFGGASACKPNTHMAGALLQQGACRRGKKSSCPLYDPDWRLREITRVSEGERELVCVCVCDGGRE